MKTQAASSPQPAENIGEQTMLHTPYIGNGAAMPSTVPPDKRFIVISDKAVYSALVAIVITLVGAGWLLLPAKDRDLKDLQKEVASISETVGGIGKKIDKLAEQTQANREEIIRLTATASVPAPAPTTEIRVVRKTRPKPQPQPNGGLGSFIFGETAKPPQ